MVINFIAAADFRYSGKFKTLLFQHNYAEIKKAEVMNFIRQISDFKIILQTFST